VRFLKGEKHLSDDNHFWISISDLMTSLLFVFILILAYMILATQETKEKADSKIKAFEKNINARTELLQTLKDSLSKNKIIVEIDKDDGTMRITKEKLFDSSKAEIRDEKKWIIEGVTTQLLELMELEKYHNAINTIFIEGHTDNINLNKGHDGFRWTNMELSSQRAINTFLLMDEISDGGLSTLTNNNGQALISYSGYSDTRPIKNVSNGTEEGRERNRRIQFFFAVNPPSMEELLK
jgi:chemotaxis protein MotB